MIRGDVYRAMYNILFRGKAINRNPNGGHRTNYKNGDWVYGLISKPYDKKYDLPAEMTNTDGITGIDVDRNTIGMWTGKVDCEENCIFENDILQDIDTGEIVIVQWFEEHIAFMVWRTSINKIEFLYSFLEGKKIKIVGNEFDNRDLIDKGMEQFIIPKER